MPWIFSFVLRGLCVYEKRFLSTRACDTLGAGRVVSPAYCTKGTEQSAEEIILKALSPHS
jgi:hypothetical protein